MKEKEKCLHDSDTRILSHDGHRLSLSLSLSHSLSLLSISYSIPQMT